MPIRSLSDSVDGIPLWILEPSAHSSAVLMYHGLHSHKGAHEKEMWQLAEAGFLAVGVDAVAHGERQTHREWNDPDVRYATLRETALEAPQVVDHLRVRFPNLRRIGAVGISLGGFTLFSAMAERPGLFDAVSAMLASPRWTGLNEASPLWQHSPHHWADRFFPSALLIQNAGLDEHVRTDHAREFAQALAARYQASPDRLSYRQYDSSGHFMRGEDWDVAWTETMEWMRRFL